MPASTFHPLQILKAAEVHIAHEHHHATLARMVLLRHLRQLFDLVAIVHGHHFRVRGNDRPHHVHDGVKARHHVGLANQLRATLR